MGLLDDAIREHLELRRRSGASEQELSVKQDEALGPARRETAAEAPEEREPLEEAQGRPDEPQVEPREAHEPAWSEEHEPRDPQEDRPAPPLPSPDEEEALEDPRDSALGEPGAGEHAHPDLASADERPDRDMPRAVEEEEAAVEPPDPPVRPQWRSLEDDEAGSAAAQQRPGRLVRMESEEGADPPEDVLQETPDFLQETPEHERLWFEQRPPRDFDFDD